MSNPIRRTFVLLLVCLVGIASCERLVIEYAPGEKDQVSSLSFNEREGKQGRSIRMEATN